MTSEVEERPRLVTAGYGGHRSQWVIMDAGAFMYAGAFSCGVFIDLKKKKKAFDTADHSILIHKLDFYGLRGLSMFGLVLIYEIEHKLQLLIKGRLTSLLLRMGSPKVLYLDLYFLFCTSMMYTPGQANLTFIFIHFLSYFHHLNRPRLSLSDLVAQSAE